jgi:tRNA pseudouridine55 synthase
MNGLLLVNKPVGISSFDVIRQLRRRTGVRKIGHAGTLDPLASGLMLMLFGTACKQALLFSKLDKRYRAQIELGFSSTTGDGEGDKSLVSKRVPSQDEILATMAGLVGEITQVPPVYSAIKIRGREAYKRIRAGESVEIPPRQVTIYENELIKYEYPLVEIVTKVSSGTYIRTLAGDIGTVLGTGAYLSGLVRCEVGKFRLEDAHDLADVNSTQPLIIVS